MMKIKNEVILGIIWNFVYHICFKIMYVRSKHKCSMNRWEGNLSKPGQNMESFLYSLYFV